MAQPAAACPIRAGLGQLLEADPRSADNQHLLASDLDRSNAGRILVGSYAEGRLEHDEYQQRLSQATRAKTLGELEPVLSDVVVNPGSVVAPAPVEMPEEDSGQTKRPTGQTKRPTRMVGPVPSWYVSTNVICNVVWLVSVIGAGRLNYYWPMWVLIGTSIAVIGWASGRRKNERTQLPPRPSGDDLR